MASLFSKLIKNIGTAVEDSKQSKESRIEEICNNDPKEKAIETAILRKRYPDREFLEESADMDCFWKNTNAQIMLITEKTEATGLYHVISERIVYTRVLGQCQKRLIEDTRSIVVNLKPMQMINTTAYQRKSSVVKSAVAGGVIAGGVGAIVGAVSAANTNANGGKTVYVNSLGDFGLHYMTEWIFDCYISEAILNKFGNPFEGEEIVNGFLHLDTYGRSKEFINLASNYLSQVTGALYQTAKDTRK